MPESRGSDRRYKAQCKTECNKTQTGEWEHSSSLYSLSVQLSDMIKRRQGSSERKWWRTKQICFCSANVPMHDAAAINVRQGVLGEAVMGWGLGPDTEEKERRGWGGEGGLHRMLRQGSEHKAGWGDKQAVAFPLACAHRIPFSLCLLRGLTLASV